MTFVVVVTLLAALMPFFFLALSGIPAKGAFSRWGPGYNNDEPRASLDKLEGWRKRAHYAQQNGHEAFAPFAAGVILATWTHGACVIPLAGSFLLLRLAHGLAYIAGSGAWRSAFWWGGFACVLGLYLSALVG
jgi:uncharacterized MAPEG superfamily protein